MITIENNKQSFVALWLELERTRQRFATEYRRFCPRRILRDWFGEEATDDFIWDVCYCCNQEGYNELPPPAEAPMKCREFLRALVTVRLGLSEFKINRSALDAARKGTSRARGMADRVRHEGLGGNCFLQNRLFC